MRTFKYLDLPCPVRIGANLFDAWRDDCRRAFTLEPITDCAPGDQVTMDVLVPANIDTTVAMTTLLWVDKLVREAILPPGRVAFEWSLQRSACPGRCIVKIFIDHAAGAAAPQAEAAE